MLRHTSRHYKVLEDLKELEGKTVVEVFILPPSTQVIITDLTILFLLTDNVGIFAIPFSELTGREQDSFVMKTQIQPEQLI